MFSPRRQVFAAARRDAIEMWSDYFVLLALSVVPVNLAVIVLAIKF